MAYERYRLIAIPELAARAWPDRGIWVRWLAAAAAFGLVLLMIGQPTLRMRDNDERRAIGFDLTLAAVTAPITVVQLLAI